MAVVVEFKVPKKSFDEKMADIAAELQGMEIETPRDALERDALLCVISGDLERVDQITSILKRMNETGISIAK